MFEKQIADAAAAVELTEVAALTDMELAHILEAHLTKGRVSNLPCYKAETWDNSFCETPKALLEKTWSEKRDNILCACIIAHYLYSNLYLEFQMDLVNLDFYFVFFSFASF